MIGISIASPLAALYYGLSWLLWLATPLLLAYRVWQGKEDKLRLAERHGIASQPRPPGKLIWAHAVSVGEGMALLPLLEALAKQHPLLLTTISRSSAELLASRLPQGVCHHYAPLDTPVAVRRFLNHWQPDLALFAEQEWWPNLLWQLQARQIPAVLLNARLSPRSLRRWHYARTFARSLLDVFALVLAQDQHSAARLTALGVADDRLTITGNLKYDAPPLPCSDEALQRWQKALAGRPCFLAASTHAGEEIAIAAMHQQLAQDHPRLLTLIAPRHPARVPTLAKQLRQQGLRIATGNRHAAPPDDDCQIFLAASFGELGLWMRLAQLVFIGGSLVPHGGQNPLEAAKLRRAVMFGRQMDNFAEVRDYLLAANAAVQVADSTALLRQTRHWLENPAMIEPMAEAGLACADSLGGALVKTLEALTPFLPATTKPAA